MANIDLSKISYSTSSILVGSTTTYKGSKFSTTNLVGKVATNDADIITGGNGQDYIEAGDGDDRIYGGNGKDTIYGGAGNDTILGDSKNALDTIEDNAKDIIYGGSGQDTIYGGNGADELYGDGKNTGIEDLLTANYDTDDAILDDYNDIIDGGNGPDRIIGGLGGDILTGGSGPDVFVYDHIADSRSTNGETTGDQGDSSNGWANNTGDWIKDFTKGQDKLDFTTLNSEQFGHPELHFSETGAEAFGIWSFHPDPADGFTYIFADTDGDGKADMAIKVTGNVDFTANDFIGVNDAPVAVDDGPLATNEDTPLNNIDVLGNDTDIDGDTLSISGTPTALHGTVTVNPDGTLNYTPDENYNGPDTITYIVTDGYLSDIGEVTIDVAAVNDAPVNTVPGTQSATEDTNLSITGLSISDVDAASGTLTTTLSVASGTLTVLSAGGASVSGSGTDTVTLTGTVAEINTTLAALNNVVYQGDLDFNGADTLTVHTDDGGNTGLDPLLTGTATSEADEDTVTIDVAAVNDAPVIIAPNNGDLYALNVAENTPNTTVIIDVNATDVDGDTIIYSLDGVDAADFTINTTTGEVKFAVAPDYEAPADNGSNNIYNFTVVASDGFLSDTQNFAVTVTNVAEGPTVAPPYSGTGDPNDSDTSVGIASGAYVLVTGTSEADTILPNDNVGLESDTGTPYKDVINGLGGNDTINAGNATDSVYGGSGDDIINGGDDGDKLYGQADNDTINGDDNNDEIYGGSGNDILNGNGGNDEIFGGSGSDTIDGGSGTDTIIGGYGADSLSGGAGNDTFEFLSVLDTGDVISDFLSVDDTLDFSAIAAITGSSATLSNTVTANSVNYFQDGANTFVWADTDGNTSTVELQVTLTGVTASLLVSSDFVL